MRQLSIRINLKLKNQLTEKLKKDEISLTNLIKSFLKAYINDQFKPGIVSKEVQKSTITHLPELSKEETQIFELVKNGPKYMDDICNATGFDFAKMSEITATLRNKKLIKADEGLLTPI